MAVETMPALANRLGGNRPQVKAQGGPSAAARPRRSLNGIRKGSPSMEDPSGESEARVYHSG